LALHAPHSIAIDNFIVGHTLAVENVVLKDEEDVEQNGEKAEAEFRRVAKNAVPVVVVVSLEEHLQNGEGAAGKVQENVANAPSIRAFPFVVHIRLRNVFDNGDKEFDIREILDETVPVHSPCSSANQRNQGEKKHPQQEQSAHFGYTLYAPFIQEALDDGDQSDDDGVQSEEDIVPFHLNDGQRKCLEVVISDGGIVEERKRINGVASETGEVESDEVKVESNDRFALEIDPALRIEGDGPGREVDPAHHHAKSVQPITPRDSDVYQFIADIGRVQGDSQFTCYTSTQTGIDEDDF